MHKMTPVTVAVLRQIAAFGPITIRDLDQLDELAGILPASGAKAAVGSLTSHQLVDGEFIHSRATKFTISNAGRRALNALAHGPNDAPVAQPRSAIGEGTYSGEDLRPYTGRTGALTPYALPSIVNGSPVDRVRPISLASPAR